MAPVRGLREDFRYPARIRSEGADARCPRSRSAPVEEQVRMHLPWPQIPDGVQRTWDHSRSVETAGWAVGDLRSVQFEARALPVRRTFPVQLLRPSDIHAAAWRPGKKLPGSVERAWGEGCSIAKSWKLKSLGNTESGSHPVRVYLTHRIQTRRRGAGDGCWFGWQEDDGYERWIPK